MDRAAYAAPVLDSLAASGRTQPVADIEPEDRERTLDEVEEAFVVREALEGLSEPCQEMLDRFFARDESYRTISGELIFRQERSRAASPGACDSYARDWRGRIDPARRSRR